MQFTIVNSLRNQTKQQETGPQIGKDVFKYHPFLFDEFFTEREFSRGDSSSNMWGWESS